MKQVQFEDLGLIPYREAWAYQEQRHRELIQSKLDNRQRETPEYLPHLLIFCEHPPVYTLGKSGSADHLLLSEPELAAAGFEYYKINRGGDITYHGPGQIVGYPIFDLDRFFTDVHRYVRYLEEAVIRTLAGYGLEAFRIKEYTGVWLEGKNGLPDRKICAIGVHLSRWVTLHGFAFNVNTQLSHFDNIVPCGIADDHKTVTSMARELGGPVDQEAVKTQLKEHLAELFGFVFAPNEPKQT